CFALTAWLPSLICLPSTTLFRAAGWRAGRDQSGGRRRASRRIEHDAMGLAWPGSFEADGQGRVVAQRGLHADDDRINLAAKAMGLPTRSLPRDPLRGPVAIRNTAVQGAGALER